MNGSESWASAVLVEQLLEVCRADPAFADLYLQRARELLSAELTEAERGALDAPERRSADLVHRIEEAVHARDWRQVQELTREATQLTRVASERALVRKAAARVFGFEGVLVDPFSPGLGTLASVPEGGLPALRDATVKRLERLRAADPGWAELYASRRSALLDVRVAESAPGPEGASRVATLEARAEAAFSGRDLSRLHELSAELVAEALRGAADEGAAPTPSAALAAPELTRPFPREVRDRAARLGLAPHRAESAFEELRARFRPGWRVTAGEPGGSTVRLSIHIPEDTDEALRDVLQLFASRPILTSAGTRYVPWSVAEDVLVEDFEEPTGAAAPAPSPLLAALGLPARNGLPRRRIEKALRERGSAVVQDLGLDPREYRAVCIPLDLYARLGPKLGLGRQAVWTHFDGYMASPDRKLMPLAGGDVRFGGLHDVIAVGSTYDSPRLLVRLAVVQRRRFAAW